jgi:CopG family nickel-responsive transcriptional regulator
MPQFLIKFYQTTECLKEMGDLSRFGVSVEDELLQSFDELINAQGYANRSEALRDLMRDALVKARLNDAPETGEVLATLTLVYDHHASELSDRMSDLQHEYFNLIVSVLHVHVDRDDCMEVIVLRGEMRDVRTIAESLLSLKGVKHGKLFLTLSARKITSSAPGGGSSAAHEHSHSHSHPHTH